LPVVADVIKLIETIAPSRLAQDWDNSGLQIGNPDWPAKRILICLDPSLAVVTAACDQNFDLLITHHPLIFKPIKAIDFTSPLGKIIDLTTRHRLAIFSAHTNLDSAAGGLNDVFAKKIGLTNLTLLDPDPAIEFCKLAVYVPVEYCQTVLDAFFELDSSAIEDYSCCTFRCQGKGTFKPGFSSKPFIGKPGEIAHIDEVKIEARIRKNELNRAIDLIRSRHPYEVMAFDAYPVYSEEAETGFGRIGRLGRPVPLTLLAQEIKSKFNLAHLRVSGPPDLPVQTVAVCTGSGSSLMKHFLKSGAQVFISGDLKYHDARDAEAYSRCLIDIGHFASEKLMIELIQERLQSLLKENKVDAEVQTWEHEKDPFEYF